MRLWISRTVCVGLLVLSFSTAMLFAAEEPLAVHVQVLQHQTVDDAVELVYRLLSEDGTVELRPGGSTLVVRDTARALERIVRLLEDFDHPLRSVRLHLQIVRAATGAPEPGEASALSPELLARLRELLRYERYHLLAEARFSVWEGESVDSRLGDLYSVAFRLGTVLADQRVKLQGFELARSPGKVASAAGERSPGERLIRTHINLWLGEPMVLGLAQAEASEEALMVIVSSSLDTVTPVVAVRGGE